MHSWTVRSTPTDVDIFNESDISPSCNAASSERLEAHNDISQLVVTFFFEMCQDTSSEEDLTLTNAKEIGVELQCFNLRITCQGCDWLIVQFINW